MGPLIATFREFEELGGFLAKNYHWRIDRETLAIHAPDGHTPSSVVVRKSGKRYRLEMV